jgi:hypothetical protein
VDVPPTGVYKNNVVLPSPLNTTFTGEAEVYNDMSGWDSGIPTIIFHQTFQYNYYIQIILTKNVQQILVHQHSSSCCCFMRDRKEWMYHHQ